jgi:hypothetical protein
VTAANSELGHGGRQATHGGRASWHRPGTLPSVCACPVIHVCRQP